MWVGISSVGDVRDARRRRHLGAPQPWRAGRLHPTRIPCSASASTSSSRRPASRRTLYQQNHCGVYRSDDGGLAWTEITPACHPSSASPWSAIRGTRPRRGSSPSTAPTRPLMPDAAAASGGPGPRRRAGTPGSRPAQEHAYVGVLREAMAVDRLDPVGVAFGTGSGELWTSADEGASWQQAAARLPPVWSVEALVVDGDGRGHRRPARSLVALFPGAERRCVVPGGTVGEVIEELEARLPGMRDRLLTAGPVIREHLKSSSTGSGPASARPWATTRRPRHPGGVGRVGRVRGRCDQRAQRGAVQLARRRPRCRGDGPARGGGSPRRLPPGRRGRGRPGSRVPVERDRAGEGRVAGPEGGPRDAAIEAQHPPAPVERSSSCDASSAITIATVASWAGTRRGGARWRRRGRVEGVGVEVGGQLGRW